MATPRVVSLTPAVFHLSDAVNQVSKTYGDAPIVPRGPRLKPLIDKVRRGIQEALACPDYEPVLMTGSGSTSMAAVMGSCLRPDERLLIVRNGAYGDRMIEYANTLKQPFVDLESPYGERPSLEAIEAACKEDRVDAIAMVYGGTSSCTLNPAAEVGAIAKKYGKKYLLDGVSSLFIEPMDLTGWNVSAVMGSCNKGLHSHPNITMSLVHTKLLGEMEKIAPRAPNLEIWKTWRAQSQGSHPYTIDPMSLCQAGAALDHLRAIGGVAGRHAIYQARCDVLRPGYERLGLKIARWPNQPLQSIGTALEIPASTTYDAMAERLASEPVEDHVFEIYAAQGKLSNKLFRIFNMGEYPLEVYSIFLEALARVLPKRD